MDERKNGNSSDFHRIEIRRAGDLQMDFRIRRLSFEDCYNCWEKVLNSAHGRKKRRILKDGFDNKFIQAHIIYAATLEEDKPKTWDSKILHSVFKTSSPIDLIIAALLDGERTQLTVEICKFSGLSDSNYTVDFDSEMEQMIKRKLNVSDETPERVLK